MGLDMYLTANRTTVGGNRWWSAEADKRPEHNGWKQDSTTYEVAYWRKHAALHCYIVNTFHDEDDCSPIHICADDCNLIADALEGKLADFLEDNEVSGFFFGSPEIWAEHLEDSKEDAATFRKLADWLSCTEQTSRDEWRSAEYQASW